MAARVHLPKAEVSMYEYPVVRCPDQDPGCKWLKQGWGAPRPLLSVLGGGAAQSPDRPAEHWRNCLPPAPNLVQPNKAGAQV